MKRDKNAYYIDNKRYDRVTNIINILDKPGLIYWYGKHGTEKANQLLKESGDIGSEIHGIINVMLKAGLKGFVAPYTRPDGALLYYAIKGCEDFLNDTGFEPLKTELTIHSMLGFAGTLDAMGTIGNHKVIIDWKSGNLYDTHKLQVSAYWAAFREMYPKEIIDRALVVQLKKTKARKQYKIMEVEDLAQTFDLFLKCYELYKWRKNG